MDPMSVLNKAKEQLEKAKDILIVTHTAPTADAIGASLALYQGLLTLNKKVTVACPDNITVEHSGFVGVNKFSTEIARKNFIISLDYQEGSIDKVSYNIEGNKFNLVIEPRTGFEPFSQENVHFSKSGPVADVIVIIDTRSLGELHDIYEKNKDLFGSVPVINIDYHSDNSNFGQINVTNTQVASTVEVVSQLLSVLGIRLTQDLASNILTALYQASDNFRHPSVSSRTFELAAACIKAGGRNMIRMNEVRQTAPDADQQVRQEDIAPAKGTGEQDKPQEQKPQPPQDQTAPEEWLRPKIFKSSNH